MPRLPIEDRAVFVIIEADDPRDLKELLRVGLVLRTKTDTTIGGEMRMHVVAPAFDEPQGDAAPVELRMGDRVLKPRK